MKIFTYTYRNSTTGLVKIGKFDNRNKQNNDELLEELLDETENPEDNKPPKKVVAKKEDNDEEEDEDLDLDLDDDEEEDNPEDEEDNENDDEEDEDLEDDEEEERKKEAARLKKEKDDKLKASQREALVQQSRNKQFTDKIKAAQNLEVTEDDLKAEASKEGLNFEELDAFQKSMLKRTILAERKFSTVSEVVVEEDRLQEWADKVDTWTDENKSDPKFSRLKGHEAEFRAFAMKESRRGLDLEDAAKLFLLDVPANKRHKGSLLLKSGGGEKSQQRRQLTEEDAVALRKKNPSLYMKLVKAGKFKIEI